MIELYMDVHVPAAITSRLRRRLVDAMTSQEDETRLFSDVALLTRATEINRVLFSQDDDLLRIANEWQREFTGLVYAHQQNASIGECIENLELIAKCCSRAEMRNRVVYLPL